MLRIERDERRISAHFHRFERSGLDQAADHRVGHTGLGRQFAHETLLPVQLFQRQFALGGHAGRGGAGMAIFDDGSAGPERGRAGQYHAQDGGKRGQIIVRGPFRQAAQFRADRRRVDHGQDIAQAVVAHFLDLELLFFPDHAHQLARTERHFDDRAMLSGHAVGHAVIERTDGGGAQQDAGAVHATDSRRDAAAPKPGRCAGSSQESPYGPDRLRPSKERRSIGAENGWCDGR